MKSLARRPPSPAATLLLLLLILLVSAPAAADVSAVKAQSPERASSGAAGSRAAANSLSAEERAKVFEEVWETIDEKYYDPAFNGVDWRAVRERYRPRAAAAAGDEEFYSLLNQMAGELRDAHTRVRSPRAREARRKRQATSAGVLIYEVEGVPVIFSVAPESDAERAGVLPGMAVRSVDGTPVAEAVARVRQEVGTSSSERATRILSYARLTAGEPDTPLRLALTRADGTEFDVTLTRRVVSTAPKLTARLLPSGYAYLHFNRFNPPVAKQVKEALEKFKDAPGLILDLRSNGGGDGREGLRVGGFFFDKKIPVARLVTRTGKPPSALFGLVSLPKEFEAGRRGGQIYANPLVVLVNEATGSTSELFASSMQEHGRARVVGTQTCGCVLGVLKHRELKGGGELSISEIGFVTPRGRRLEGDGVMPDTPVAHTLGNLRSRRDAALEEAEKYLNGLTGKSTPAAGRINQR